MLELVLVNQNCTLSSSGGELLSPGETNCQSWHSSRKKTDKTLQKHVTSMITAM